jgi:hypothetical protein
VSEAKPHCRAGERGASTSARTQWGDTHTCPALLRRITHRRALFLGPFATALCATELLATPFTPESCRLRRGGIVPRVHLFTGCHAVIAAGHTATVVVAHVEVVRQAPPASAPRARHVPRSGVCAPGSGAHTTPGSVAPNHLRRGRPLCAAGHVSTQCARSSHAQCAF